MTELEVDDSMGNMKIIFMGSPDFAVPTLQKLIESKHEVIACFSQPARPKNRGKKMVDTAIATLALKHNIPIHTPTNLKAPETKKLITELEADFIIVVAYGLLLPIAVLEAAKYAPLNLHPSSLPRFRGAAPLQRTLMAGDQHTDICIMQMSEGLDEGAIYKSQNLNIPQDMILGELHDQCANIGADLMLDVINNFKDLPPETQSDDGVIYAKKIAKSEAEIDFNKPGLEILNLIRALNPFPGAFMFDESDRVKIFSAKFTEKTHAEKPGSINNGFEIYCENGVITPITLQRAGKNKVTLPEFLNGRN